MKAVEILATVKAKLLAQGAKSQDEDTCVYNSPNKMHCGIGWLAPGADFEEGLAVIESRLTLKEGRIFHPNANTELLRELRVISQEQFDNPVFLGFLRDVQSAHDTASKRHFCEHVSHHLDALKDRAEELDA